jgi:hypothetical protein
MVFVGKGPTDKGRVHHNRMRKWVKSIHARKHREAFHHKETKGSRDLSPLLKFDQSQERHVLKLSRKLRQHMGKNVHPIVLSQ